MLVVESEQECAPYKNTFDVMSPLWQLIFMDYYEYCHKFEVNSADFFVIY